MDFRRSAALKIALRAFFFSLLLFLPPSRFAAHEEPKAPDKSRLEQKGTNEPSADSTGQSQRMPSAKENGQAETSFSKDIVVIFNEQKCTVCHRGENPSGLDITDAVAYKNLVGAKSVQNPESVLVKPGDPDSSYLMVKLTGKGKEGTIMPPKGKLPQEVIDKISAWIKEGAKNN